MNFRSLLCSLRWGLISLSLLALIACKTELHTNMSEADANEMLAKLLQYGISADKKIEKDGVTLMVEKSQFGEAVDLLANHGLPRKTYQTVGDIFQSNGLVASPLQEWARLTYAKSQELTKTLSTIPGVIKADVHIGETRKETPFEEPKPPSASVVIQMNEKMIPDDIVPQIKQLISLAHPEISYDRVGVMVTPVRQMEVTQPVSNVGGLLVHKDSASSIQYLFAVAALAILASILSLSMAVFQWRKRKAAVV
jgi:type III secretion protein J